MYIPQRGHKISTSYQRYVLTTRVGLYMRCTQGQNKEYLLLLSRSVY